MKKLLDLDNLEQFTRRKFDHTASAKKGWITRRQHYNPEYPIIQKEKGMSIIERIDTIDARIAKIEQELGL